MATCVVAKRGTTCPIGVEEATVAIDHETGHEVRVGKPVQHRRRGRSDLIAILNGDEHQWFCGVDTRDDEVIVGCGGMCARWANGNQRSCKRKSEQ